MFAVSAAEANANSASTPANSEPTTTKVEDGLLGWDRSFYLEEPVEGFHLFNDQPMRRQKESCDLWITPVRTPAEKVPAEHDSTYHHSEWGCF